MRPGVGAVVEGTVAKDDVWTDGALGAVVVGRDTGDVQESEDLIFVLEQALGKALPPFMGIDVCGEVKKAVLEPPDLSGKEKRGRAASALSQTMGVSQEAFYLFFGNCEVRGRMVAADLLDLPMQVDKTLLVDAFHLVVGAEEVGDDDARERMPQEFLGDFASTAIGDPGVGPGFVGHGPKPSLGAVDLPTGFVHVLDGSGLEGRQDDPGLHAQVMGQALKGLGDGAFGHGQPHKVFEQSDDLIARHDDVVFEPDHGGQGLRSQVAVGDFIRSGRGGDQGLTAWTPIAAMDEADRLYLGGDDVFLDVFFPADGRTQGVAAVGACGQFLDDLAVDMCGFEAGDAGVSGFSAPTMGR